MQVLNLIVCCGVSNALPSPGSGQCGRFAQLDNLTRCATRARSSPPADVRAEGLGRRVDGGPERRTTRLPTEQLFAAKARSACDKEHPPLKRSSASKWCLSDGLLVVAPLSNLDRNSASRHRTSTCGSVHPMTANAGRTTRRAARVYTRPGGRVLRIALRTPTVCLRFSLRNR